MEVVINIDNLYADILKNPQVSIFCIDMTTLYSLPIEHRETLAAQVNNGLLIFIVKIYGYYARVMIDCGTC